MKKLFYTGLFLFAAAELGAQCTPTFYDDFETGAPSASWAIGTGHTMAVNTATPAVGTYSMHMTGSSAFYSGPNVMFPSSQPTYVSWWIKTNTTNAANGYFVLGDANINSDNGVLFAYCNASSGLRFFASTGYNHPITANTWYHVEVMNINWTARNMDIYVNGVLILTAWPFRSATATSVDRLHLFNLSSATASYDNIQIGLGSTMSLTNSVTQVACNGATTGAIDLSVTGGTAPYTYSWSNSATTEDVSGVGAGTYSVTVTDNVGCTSTASFTVTEPPALVLSATSTNVTCFAGTDGTADLTASGGTPGYSYAWSSGATTEDVTNLAAGTYTIVLSDANGCTGVLAGITVTEPAEILAAVSVTDVTCGGGSDGSATVTPTGGIPGYTYAWAPAGGTAATATGLTAGNYTCTITDANGCTRLQAVIITEPTAITASITATNATCNGGSDGSAMISATGGTPGYAYSWTSGGTAATENNLAAGSYSCTVTDTAGCTYTTSVTITEPAAIVAASSATGVTCPGGADGTAIITATGGTPGYTFTWSNGDQFGTADSLSAGTHTCTITDANGCTLVDTVTITEPSPIVINLSVTNTTSCGGNEGMIDATVTGGTGPYTYSWNNGPATEDNFALVAGSYTLTVTDSLGCTAMNNADVNNPPAPVVTLTFATDIYCLDDANVTLTGESPAGGTWSGPGVSGGAFDPSTAGTGTHTITYTYTDANNCTAAATDVITVNACVGIAETTLAGWNIYPNPNSGTFTLASTTSGDVRFEVVDVQGRTVYTASENNVTPGSTRQIMLEGISTGMYLLRVTDLEKGTTGVYKISVQR